MSRYYDRLGEPITSERWIELRGNADYTVVAQDVLPDGRFVSTVWLGLDHNFSGKGPPLIFETRAFSPEGKALDASCRRYSSLAGARAGHAEAIDSLFDEDQRGGGHRSHEHVIRDDGYCGICHERLAPPAKGHK